MLGWINQNSKTNPLQEYLRKLYGNQNQAAAPAAQVPTTPQPVPALQTGLAYAPQRQAILDQAMAAMNTIQSRPPITLGLNASAPAKKKKKR